MWATLIPQVTAQAHRHLHQTRSTLMKAYDTLSLDKDHKDRRYDIKNKLSFHRMHAILALHSSFTSTCWQLLDFRSSRLPSNLSVQLTCSSPAHKGYSLRTCAHTLSLSMYEHTKFSVPHLPLSPMTSHPLPPQGGQKARGGGQTSDGAKKSLNLRKKPSADRSGNLSRFN